MTGAEEHLEAADAEALPPHGDPLADVAIVPLIDADPDSPADPIDKVEQAAAANLADLKQSLGDLRTQLAGTAATGVPAVDEALEQLGGLDPDDLAGSASILEDVLERLEKALRESRQE